MLSRQHTGSSVVSPNTFTEIKKKIDTLIVVSLAEVAGKIALGSGFATSVRPRKYYKISKETMETSLEDIEQLINFFVIEAQRIVFAENVAVTGAVSDAVSRNTLTCSQLTGLRLRISRILPHQDSPVLGPQPPHNLHHFPRSSCLHLEQGAH
jgi:hypothetical protein